jgi:hypothetical protein
MRDEPVSEPKPSGKPFDISKWLVWEAWKRVKANKGAAGVDEESIAEFERNLQRNLYRIAEALRALLSRPCWPISSSTTRSICG